MKKFMKFMSLSLAAALVFGMSVSAAGSSDTGNNPPAIIAPDGMTEEEYDEWQDRYPWISGESYMDWSRNYADDMSVGQYQNWKYYDADLTADEYKAFLEETKVEVKNWKDLDGVSVYPVHSTKYKEGIEKNVNKDETKNSIKTAFSDPRYAEVVKVFNLNVWDKDAYNGSEITIDMPEALAHETYYIVHFKDAIDYEILEIIPAKVKDGSISFSVETGSPFAIVKMDPTRTTFNETGEAAEPSESTTDAPASTPAAPAPGTSPKTGESVPVSGILAVILMAGAIVCANRVRYNK